MKTQGICGKQSARKHRKRGDYVIHLRGFLGRYTWLHHRMLAPWEEKVSASQVRQEQRVARINGRYPTLAIIDDIPPVAGGEQYWPKRRNQYSKPYRVRSVSTGGVVWFDRGEGSEKTWLPAHAFLDMVGKKVMP